MAAQRKNQTKNESAGKRHFRLVSVDSTIGREVREDAILGIDPGPTYSHFAVWHPCGPQVLGFGRDIPNATFLRLIVQQNIPRVSLEWIESYGKAVGQSVFHTVCWCGRMIERLTAEGQHWIYAMPRRTTKAALGLPPNAKDTHVLHSLRNLFPETGRTGKGEPSSQGSKDYPGPLYGIAGDTWHALGIAYALHVGMAPRFVVTPDGQEHRSGSFSEQVPIFQKEDLKT